MNSKKNLVEKSKTAKPKAVAKPKATKKNLVEKPKPVSKPNAVAKPKTTKKVSVEKLNKKRIWKGGNADADADEIIRILKDIKTEYFDFLISNIEAKNITASYNEFIDFVLHFFQDPSKYSIINYELITTQDIIILMDDLNKYGITTNDDVNNKFIKLISLFNIIRAIYNMNVAFNIKDFVYKMDNYKNYDKNHYDKLLYNTNNIWWLTKKSISRANSSSSIDPSVYKISSNNSSSIASRLSTNSSFTTNVNSGRSALSSMSKDSFDQFDQNKR